MNSNHILFLALMIALLAIILVPSPTTLADDGVITSPLRRLFKKFTNIFNQNHDKNNDQHEQKFLERMKHYESQLLHTKVWLTVSSVVNVTGHDDHDDHNDLVVRALEIHWRRPNAPDPGDHLALYRVNDSVRIRTYPLITDSNQTFPRYYRTDISFDYQNLTNLTLANASEIDCYEYYLTYVNGEGQVESFNCIHIRSRWMEQDFQLIQNRKLSEIMIPGTHDASSYERYDYDTYENDILNRFQYTQDESLYNQLAYGIRYMDWRVAVYNETISKRLGNGDDEKFHFVEEFWMVHDMQRNRITLKQALKQVVRFLERTTHEIVIIDFHRFVHGFDGETDLQAVRRRLHTFIQIINEQIGQYLIPYSNQGLPTIGQIIGQGKRVLLGYAYKFDARQMPDSRLFWPRVQHLWANTDQMNNLERYIDEQICKPPDQYHNKHNLRAVMAELTPTVEGILFRRYHGLREMASLVNLHFEQWFRHRWWHCANIVAADFFLGSDLVDITVDVNRRRFSTG